MVVQRLMTDGAASTNVKPTSSTGELRLSEKLVTVETLKQKLTESTTTLCVPAKAVVTPAVKDELKQRGIELRKVDAANDCRQDNSPVVIDATKISASAAWKSVQRVEQIGSLQQAVGRAVNVAKTEQMVVVLSDQPEVAVAAANRQSGVRAMVACGSHDWQSAAKTLGANLIVCQPSQWQDSEVPRFLSAAWNLRGSAGPNWMK